MSACDVCDKPATHQSIIGSLCGEHWDDDKVIRSAYFKFLADGGKPDDFRLSDAKKTALAAMAGE